MPLGKPSGFSYVHFFRAMRVEYRLALADGYENIVCYQPKVVSNLFEGELIINHSKDWQLWRGEIKTGNRHAHFNTKSALDKFLKLIKEGIMPTSEHYIISAKRLFTDEELSLLKIDQHKERYHNKIKTMRKQRKVFKYR